jgi:orotate phosphoribosyltransferase-like protein
MQKKQKKSSSKKTQPEKTIDPIRDRALQLRDQGMTSKQIAHELKVPPTTIAAYLAHHTRGTYA